MKKIFTNLLLFCFISIYSQEMKSVYPNFYKKPIKEVLKNTKWTISSKTEGFLNLDKVTDTAIILESKDSILETRIDEKPRKNIAKILLVFINNIVVNQNNTFIARDNEGGMNYVSTEISIKKSKLNIFVEYLRSSTKYSFNYLKGEFFLNSAKSFSRHSASGDFEIEFYDFNKEILFLEIGNISKKEMKKKQIPFKLKKGLRKLSDLKQIFEWEVIKDRYL